MEAGALAGTEVGAPARLKSGLAAFDTLDDRREMAALLERLPPAKRVAFVAWCCRQVTVPNSAIHPRVAARTHDLAALARWDDSAVERLRVDLWTDLWMLAAQYGLDMDAAAARLVAMVRRKEG